MAISFGLLGASKIAPKVLVAPAAHMDEVQLKGVAARDKNRAKQFASEHQIETVFLNYQELLQSPDIDAVYLSVTNDQHFALALEAINAQKHLLIEKPVCLHALEAKQLSQAASDKGVHLLEAVMVQHHDWQTQIKKFIDTRPFGDLKQIHSQISYYFNEWDSYRFQKDKGGGAFYDLGPYWLQFLQATLGLGSICQWEGMLKRLPTKEVDLHFQARLDYKNGSFATLACSLQNNYAATHKLEFERATISVKNFFRCALGKHKLTIEIKMADGKLEKQSFPPQNYYENQLQFFINVLQGKIPNLPFSQSMQRIELMETIYQSAQETIHEEPTCL